VSCSCHPQAAPDTNWLLKGHSSASGPGACKALYSVPGNLIGHYVEVRAARALVNVSFRGQLVKVHPRTTPGGRTTDPADLPLGATAYALGSVTLTHRRPPRDRHFADAD